MVAVKCLIKLLAFKIMNKHLLSTNYKNLGTLPLLDSASLLAEITSIRFGQRLSFSDGERSHSRSIHMHSKIKTPKKYENLLLEVLIMPFKQPELIGLSDESEYGVGVLHQGGFEGLALDTVFEPEPYRELYQLLFSFYLNREMPIFIDADVLGLGKGCEWNMDAGPLLVKQIDFTVGSHKT